MTPPLLEIDGLHMRFQGVVALDNVSFSLDEGKVTALIGPNGAGKTTMFNCVTGMYKPTDGAIRLKGETITGLKAHRIAKHGIARTFQNLALFSGLTVLQNLLVGAYLKGSSGLRQGAFHTPKTRAEDRKRKPKHAPCSPISTSRTRPTPSPRNCPVASRSGSNSAAP